MIESVNKPQTPPLKPTILTILLLLFLIFGVIANSFGQCECEPLTDFSGTSVVVSSVAELDTEIGNATGPKTIYVEDGIYDITYNFFHITNPDITIRSLSGNREDCVFQGGGMAGPQSHGFLVDASNITLADFTIRDISVHPIQVQPWNSPTGLMFHNLHIIDGGEQLFKVSTSAENTGTTGIIECCTLEYETTLNNGNYTNGIDIHKGINWIIRNNTIRNIKAAPGDGMAGPAILMWSVSENTIVENNTIIDCDMGIFFGNSSHDYLDHIGGVIRNNVIKGYSGSDAGIGLVRAQGALVENNSIYNENQNIWSVEVRFPLAFDNVIVNNICDNEIKLRDGGEADIISNMDFVNPDNWVDPANGDLHLADDSDAINAGLNQPTAGFDERMQDMDCHPINDGMVDIGADEYASVVTAVLENSLPSVSIIQLGEKLVVSHSHWNGQEVKLRSLNGSVVRCQKLLDSHQEMKLNDLSQGLYIAQVGRVSQRVFVR